MHDLDAKVKKFVSYETRLKLSMAHKGKPKSPEHCANMRNPKSEEHKAKISAALKGGSLSEEHIEKIIATYRRKTIELNK
jgi:hypothetical protein